MAYIPIIGPSIILIKISPSPDTSGKNIVERFYKLPIFILRMEETGFGVEQVAVVVGFAQVMFGFVSLTQFGCDL